MLAAALIIGVGAILGLAWGWWSSFGRYKAWQVQAAPSMPDQVAEFTVPSAETTPDFSADSPAAETKKPKEESTPPPAEVQESTQTELTPEKVAVATDRLAHLLEEHNRIESARLQPRFHFVRGECGEGEEATDCLEIWNKGEEILSFEATQFSFLEITYYEYNSYQTRYIPFYYFLDRRYTNKYSGLLVVLEARSRSHNRNTRFEVERLKSELQAEFGRLTAVNLKVFLQVHYTDLAGTPRQLDYDVSEANSGEESMFVQQVARPAGYSLNPYWQYLTGAPVIWHYTGKGIREGWDRLLTRENLELFR